MEMAPHPGRPTVVIDDRGQYHGITYPMFDERGEISFYWNMMQEPGLSIAPSEEYSGALQGNFLPEVPRKEPHEVRDYSKTGLAAGVDRVPDGWGGSQRRIFDLAAGQGDFVVTGAALEGEKYRRKREWYATQTTQTLPVYTTLWLHKGAKFKVQAVKLAALAASKRVVNELLWTFEETREYFEDGLDFLKNLFAKQDTTTHPANYRVVKDGFGLSYEPIDEDPRATVVLDTISEVNPSTFGTIE